MCIGGRRPSRRGRRSNREEAICGGGGRSNIEEAIRGGGGGRRSNREGAIRG